MKRTQPLLSILRSLDVRIVLIVMFVAVSTGHVGCLFADREDVRQAFVGYVLALSVDGVLVVSLYEVANVRRPSHRAFALFVFLIACAVSGGFNVYYYCLNYTKDPLWISILLGLTAPVLAAFLAVLRSFGDVRSAGEQVAERQAERSLDLEKYRAEQAERTRCVQIEQTERTKQVRAQARAERAKAQAAVEMRTAKERERTDGNGRRAPGELDDRARAILVQQPDIGPRPLARELDISPSTASGILRRLKERNGSDL